MVRARVRGPRQPPSRRDPSAAAWRARAPGGERRVKVRGAVLREMGVEAPYAESRPLELADLELDPPGPGEMLVRVGAAGLCHSDLSVIDGSRPRVMPMVLGHEAAGEVIETGPDTEGFAAGDPPGAAFVSPPGRRVPGPS